MDRVDQLAERYVRHVLADHKPDSEVIYAGVFLDSMARKKLLGAFPPEHSTLHAHHMTIWHFRDGGGEPELPWGKTVSLKVVGHFADGRAQAVIVDVPSILRPRNRVPHVTLSTSDGVGPAASNDLLPTTWDKVRGMVAIKGKVGWMDAQERVHLNRPE